MTIISFRGQLPSNELRFHLSFTASSSPLLVTLRSRRLENVCGLYSEILWRRGRVVGSAPLQPVVATYFQNALKCRIVSFWLGLAPKIRGFSNKDRQFQGPDSRCCRVTSHTFTGPVYWERVATSARINSSRWCKNFTPWLFWLEKLIDFQRHRTVVLLIIDFMEGGEEKKLKNSWLWKYIFCAKMKNRSTVKSPRNSWFDEELIVSLNKYTNYTIVDRHLIQLLTNYTD